MKIDEIDNANRIMSKNIAEQRKFIGITQQQLADRLTESTGRNVTVTMVSSWERGKVYPPAPIMPFICSALSCPSYRIFPQSHVLSDRDFRLIEYIRFLDDSDKKILDDIAVRWPGSVHRLIQALSAYTVLSECRRAWIVRSVLHEFRGTLARNELDSATVPISVRSIEQLINDLEENDSL